jgi:FHA domain
MATPMPPEELSTTTDPRARTSWAIHDPVIRLREWASDRVHGLPDPPVAAKIGSVPSCQLQLLDPSGLVSREHAMLTPLAGGGWRIRDLGSKNGLRRDGERRPDFKLRPGLEITIGGLRLVAESAQLVGLRAVLCRFLGWAPERQAEVDNALRSLRDWAEHDLPLVLIGEGDLTPVVGRLHALALGPSVGLIVYDDGDPAAAIDGAQRGVLCVVMHRQAPMVRLVELLRETEQGTRPQLVLCTRSSSEAAALSVKLGRCAVISLPDLSTRKDELEHVVQESALDIAGELEAPTPGFTMHDLQRFREIEFRSIADIEETVRRVIAMRTWGVTAGAARLGIAHTSLSTWARRPNRKLST